ncbi:hypothetical protein [Burkholderia lata]|nr:hypothetical protein [Burkholderia lata]
MKSWKERHEGETGIRREQQKGAGAERGKSKILTNAERTELEALLLVHHELLAAVPVRSSLP